MATHVAFLRAINLGARRKFPKADIVAATEGAGFTGVATHINTGNVRLETRMRSRSRIEAALEQAYLDRIGFEVPTICFTAVELIAIVEYAEELRHDGKHFVSLLKAEPDAELVSVLTSSAPEGEQVIVRGRAVHLLLGENYHTATTTNTAVERRLGVATNRTIGVLRTVADKWCR